MSMLGCCANVHAQAFSKMNLVCLFALGNMSSAGASTVTLRYSHF